MTRVLRLFVVMAVATVFMAPQVKAKESFLDRFLGQYPSAAGSKLSVKADKTCLVCHTKGSKRNPYGVAWKEADKNFLNIENLDSDGDGVSNIDEINALTYPGDATDFSLPPDETSPVIAVLGDNPATVAYGETYTDAGATATDNVDGDLTVQIQESGSVDTNTPGTYVITYTVSDEAGNAAEATRQVTVTPPPDQTAPVITVLGDNPATVEEDGAYEDAGATATDDVDGDLTAQIQMTGSVDTNRPDTYIIIYTVSDDTGNVAHAMREVVVVPEPVLGALAAALSHTDGDPLAFGTSSFEARESGSTFSLDFDRIFSASMVEIFAGGTSLGTVGVVHGGAGISLDTRDGDTVPDLHMGTAVEVRDTADGMLLLSGTLAGSMEMHPRRMGDVNHHGSFDIADLREVTLTALGEQMSQFDADIDGNGVTEAFDIQIQLDAGCAFRRAPLYVQERLAAAIETTGGDVGAFLDFFDADVDGDGFVGGTDLLVVWGAALGHDPGELDTDINGDSVTDGADVDLVIDIAASHGCEGAVDVDSSGNTDAIDVQLVVNGALGLPGDVTGVDVDGSGATTAVDIQLVINGALGIIPIS